MIRVRRSVVILAGVVFFAVASGGYTVMQARSEYYGVCSKLSGFPGILQRAGLLATGTCVSRIGEPLCSAGGTCTVGTNSGTCKNTGKIGEPAICTCVVPVSP